MRTFVILHNIRSTHNVGAIFRTADGAGVDTIFLTGYTPAPVDRFGRPVPSILKTALGATESVSWQTNSDIGSVIAELKREGVRIVAVEQDSRAVDYRSLPQRGDVAFIFGNEVEGVPEEVRDAADAIAVIPMHGMKESLNVSVAVGIVLFQAKEKTGTAV